MPLFGVTLVCNSRSPVMAPTSSVITPPMVETKVERKGRLDMAPPKSARPARCAHLSEGGLLCGVHAETPIGLDPDPPPGVLTPVVAVRRLPCLRTFVPLRAVSPGVGAQENLGVVGVRLAVRRAPRGRAGPGAPGVRERDDVVYVDHGRIGQRLPRVRVEPRPGRYGAVGVDPDALAVSDQGGVPHVAGAVGLPPTVARRVRGPVRELFSGVPRHAPGR